MGNNDPEAAHAQLFSFRDSCLHDGISRLSIVADLKRAQVVQAIETLETLALAIATRSAPLSLLNRYYRNNITDVSWNFSVEE